jgi:hypothetical protein
VAAPTPTPAPAPVPAAGWKAWPPALRLSVAFGIVGAVVLLVGLVTGSTPVLVVATTAGAASLISALVWRAQLIEAWRKEHGRPTRDW